MLCKEKREGNFSTQAYINIELALKYLISPCSDIGHCLSTPELCGLVLSPRLCSVKRLAFTFSDFAGLQVPRRPSARGPPVRVPYRGGERGRAGKAERSQ